MNVLLGVDVGASTISGGLVTDDGEVLAATERPTHVDGPGTALATLVRLVDDLRARAEVQALVRRLIAEEGVSTLWATHVFDEVARGDEVVILHRGAVLATGSVAEIAGEGTLAARFLAMTGEDAEAIAP